MTTVRSGTALVLALVLLAALLLLGLPFLFSQSTSVSGTRAYAAQREAFIGRDNAQNLATAIAAYAMTPSLTAGIPPPPASNPLGFDQYSCLATAFNPSRVLPSWSQSVRPIDANPEVSDGTLGITPGTLGIPDTLGFNLPPGQAIAGQMSTYLGAILSDEAGKLDPNNMSPVLWTTLLLVLGIPDWNDNKVYPAVGANPPPGTYIPSPDQLGQLAKSLASLRFNLPQGRITTLEQLLKPNPQDAEPGTPKKLRWPLTRSELERLRPYLTLYNTRVGRNGLIDLGTVIAIDSQACWRDSQPDRQAPLMGIGTMLLSEEESAPGVHKLAEITGTNDTGTSSTFSLQSPDLFSVNVAGPLVRLDQSLMLDAPTALNLHQLSPLVRTAVSYAGNYLDQTSLDLTHPPALLLLKPLIATGNPLVVDATAVTTINGLWHVPSRLDSSSSVSFFDLSPFSSPLSPRNNEIPQLDIRSSGTFTVEAAATITDVLDRQIAQEHRRVVVQAVPQEYLMERRWLTQGDMHELVKGRWGSHVQAWPLGYERLNHVPPADADLSSTTATIAPDSGLRPRPLPAFSSFANGTLALTHLVNDWEVPFGADAPTDQPNIFSAKHVIGIPGVVQGTLQPLAVTVAALNLDPLTTIVPDGCALNTTATSGQALAYSLATDYQNGTTVSTNTTVLERRDGMTAEMGARQLSFWIKPQATWSDNSGVYPLMEARMPSGNAGYINQPLVASPTQGSPLSENYFGLYYDSVNTMLVLAIAPPSIEHVSTVSDGPLTIPFENRSSGNVLFDARSDVVAATGGGALLAPSQYADNGQGLNGRFTTLFAPNRVLHCYYTPHRSNLPYFQGGQWYHIQIAIASDRPEGIAIMVDGDPGQDLAVSDPANLSAQNPGDHITLPGVILQQDLTIISAGDPNQSIDIDIKAPLGLSPNSLLPDHGVVRIDDEYISYQGLSPTQLLHCYRGVRQETNSSSPNQFQAWPQVQFHRQGSLVVPGGFHCAPAPGAGQLYGGGCILGQALHDGEPPIDPLNPVSTSYQIYSGVLPPGGNPTMTITAPASGTFQIPVGFGQPATFPAQGIVRLQGHYFYYNNGAEFIASAANGTTLNNVTDLTGWTFQGNGPLGSLTFTAPDTMTLNQGDPVLLVSIYVTGANPTDVGRYSVSGNTATMAISLQDPSGRVQWIRYESIAARPGGSANDGFFINNTGFNQVSPNGPSRGLCRTYFQGNSPPPFPLLTPPEPFVSGSLVIPVQTELQGAGHWLVTGDVVTLSTRPSNPSSTLASLPVQMVVRYAASDGFASPPFAPLLPGADSPNSWFAFDRPLPPWIATQTGVHSVPWSQWEILSGPCWSGDDLSPGLAGPLISQRAPQPRGYLPRIDFWSNAPTDPANGDATVWFASEDQSKTTPAKTTACTLDDICAGPLEPSPANTVFDAHDATTVAPINAIGNGVRLFWTTMGPLAGTPSLTLAPTADLSQVVVQTTTPMFNWTLGKMGLVEIDGEVFAYQQPTQADADAIVANKTQVTADYPNFFPPILTQNDIITNGYYAHLVGRNLLCPVMPPQVLPSHTMGGSLGDGPLLIDGLPHWPILPAIRLPLGPVFQVQVPVVDGGWFGLCDTAQSTTYQALNAPAALITAADGSAMEVLQLIGPKNDPPPSGSPSDPDLGKYTTASWIRGLYNSEDMPRTLKAWGTGTLLNPLVIGWWPRYASALPASAAGSLPPSATASALFRSRTFSWVGFPLGLYGAYFDQTRISGLPSPFTTLHLADVVVDGFVPASSSTSYFTMQARALAYADQWSSSSGPPAATMDWSLQQPADLLTAAPVGDASTAFAPSNDGGHTFSDGTKILPVDGAELRINWFYHTGIPSSNYRLEDLADAGNRAPQVNAVRLRALAPVRVLQTDAEH